MSEHTPGPWTFSADYDERSHDYNWDVVSQDHAHYVCEVYSNLGDARLIAAAPDLLAALEQIADLRASIIAARTIATIAIAKAKGTEVPA
jgi:hypothetical protein